jgi:hypothetical protein
LTNSALREIQRKCPDSCKDTLENAPKSSWRPFKWHLKGMAPLWGMPKLY